MLSVGTERFGIETQAHNGYNLQLQQQGKTTHTKNRNVKWLKMHHNYIYSCETIYIVVIYIYAGEKSGVCTTDSYLGLLTASAQSTDKWI